MALLDTVVRVYNLWVAQAHTYLVGQEGLLVYAGCDDLDAVDDLTKGIISFSKKEISSLNGFSDKIASMALSQGLALHDFKTLEERAASALSKVELDKINIIRTKVPQPDANTIMQKVIHKSDISKYLSGTYTSCKGYMTTCADANHLTTYEDVYYGMRLDYANTKYTLSDGSCGVIRFKARNSATAIIPKSPANRGDVTDGFPFTGHGFTSGTNGRLGVPEWRMDNMADIKEADLWELFSDGTEKLLGKFDEVLGKFTPI